MGTKRGRLLIRQPRIKRDSDPFNSQSPDLDTDSSTFTQRLLTVPHPKIERHASEPAPNMTLSTSHLLPVPQHTPFLVKQHSHPLLLQTHSSGGSGSGSFDLPSPPTQHFTLHRQLSYPTTSVDSTLASTASTAIVIPITTTTSSVTMTQLFERTIKNEDQLQLHHHQQQQHHLQQASSSQHLHLQQTSTQHHQSQQQHLQCITKSRAISPTIVVVSEPVVSAAAPATILHEHISTIRVKGEELQRSISSPQPSRILSLESRSQHCPVIRPGPALGCNFCWNTIDGHGRILRRKTKYHCPECQTNLCIVPCFQEYHERQSNEGGTSSGTNTGGTSGGGGGGGGGSSSSSGVNPNENVQSSKTLQMPSLRLYPKTGSL